MKLNATNFYQSSSFARIDAIFRILIDFAIRGQVKLKNATASNLVFDRFGLVDFLSLK